MKIQDIQIPDRQLQKQFIETWMNGDYAGALRILANNTQLDSKKFIDETMNVIGNALLALEEAYQQDFPEYLELELDRYNIAINDFIYRKDWDGSVEYRVGNTVAYQKKIYFCIANNQNVVPTNTKFWFELNIQGDQGAPNFAGKIKYNWEPIKAYVKNDIVLYSDWLWIAIAPSTSQIPADSSTYWAKFLKVPKVDIVTSAAQPAKIYDGLIWFKILNP